MTLRWPPGSYANFPQGLYFQALEAPANLELKKPPGERRRNVFKETLTSPGAHRDLSWITMIWKSENLHRHQRVSQWFSYLKVFSAGTHQVFPKAWPVKHNRYLDTFKFKWAIHPQNTQPSLLKGGLTFFASVEKGWDDSAFATPNQPLLLQNVSQLSSLWLSAGGDRRSRGRTWLS